MEIQLIDRSKTKTVMPAISKKNTPIKQLSYPTYFDKSTIFNYTKKKRIGNLF